MSTESFRFVVPIEVGAGFPALFTERLNLFIYNETAN